MFLKYYILILLDYRASPARIHSAWTRHVMNSCWAGPNYGWPYNPWPKHRNILSGRKLSSLVVMWYTRLSSFFRQTRAYSSTTPTGDEVASFPDGKLDWPILSEGPFTLFSRPPFLKSLNNHSHQAIGLAHRHPLFEKKININDGKHWSSYILQHKII